MYYIYSFEYLYIDDNNIKVIYSFCDLFSHPSESTKSTQYCSIAVLQYCSERCIVCTLVIMEGYQTTRSTILLTGSMPLNENFDVKVIYNQISEYIRDCRNYIWSSLSLVLNIYFLITTLHDILFTRNSWLHVKVINCICDMFSTSRERERERECSVG